MADAAEAVKGGLSTAFNTAKKAVVPVAIGLAISIGLAFATGGGSAVLDAAAQTGHIGLKDIGGAAVEGIRETAQNVSGWLGAASGAPGVN